MLTLNNEEAEINVSQVIPVSAKILTNVNNQTTTEFEFKDVGIILKITPTITGDDKVRLTINQESSSIATQQSSVSITQNAITTLKRKLSTKVLVDDSSVMAIGGLIQDQTVVSESKGPPVAPLASSRVFKRFFAPVTSCLPISKPPWSVLIPPGKCSPARRRRRRPSLRRDSHL